MNKQDRIKLLSDKHQELHQLVEKLERSKDAPRQEIDMHIKQIKKLKLFIKDETEKLLKQDPQT